MNILVIGGSPKGKDLMSFLLWQINGYVTPEESSDKKAIEQ